MQSDPTIPPSNQKPDPGTAPVPSQHPDPPILGAPPGLSPGSPPPLPSSPTAKSSGIRQLLTLLLSIAFVLFLADAVVSLTDDSCIVLFGNHFLSGLRQIVLLVSVLAGILIYVLMGITPMIPKRLFVPVALFNLVAGLAEVPFVIYFYGRIQQVTWLFSFIQVVLGLALLFRFQGGFELRWPLIGENQLAPGRFSWANLVVFVLLNAFVLLPGAIVCLACCASLAIGHFSEGFLVLRPSGLAVQVRKYARSDGKTIQLVPMSHVGEPEFYRGLMQSFPPDATILMEGVSDNRNLLTNRITYRRMAKSLGLAPQERVFRPRTVQMVRADVDVEQFGTNTIDFLNLVMLIHAKGINPENLIRILQYAPPPQFEEQLINDLLRKRNERLLEELHAQLLESDYLIVPWGAAHMPEIARQIQKSGFHLQESQEYVAIRFHAPRKKSDSG
jgi:hypothetical protein